MAERLPRRLPEPLLPLAIELEQPDSKAAQLRAKAGRILTNMDQITDRLYLSDPKRGGFRQFLTKRQVERREVSFAQNEAALERTLFQIGQELKSSTSSTDRMPVAKPIRGIPNTDHPAYFQMEKDGRFLSQAPMSTGPFLPDDYSIPPSTRTIKPESERRYSDGKKMTAQEHLVNTKAILERGTVKKYGVELPLTDGQIKRREEEIRRMQARLAFDEARGRIR